MEMTVFALPLFLRMGVIVILTMVLEIIHIAIGIVIPLEEFFVVPKQFANDIVIRLRQNAVTVYDVVTCLLHFL
tara:strand:- start:155 stop:376 length:222 start_codon:yes stop_codon:yes gene_type:complete